MSEDQGQQPGKTPDPSASEKAPDEAPANEAAPGFVRPVDMELLRALVRHELPEQQARAVYRLILTDKAWDDAHEQLLLEKLQQIKDRDREPS